MDYYKTLGIDRNATSEQIKKAYRKLARKHHPDLNPNDTAANKRFQEINEANEVLSDPESRKKYDKYGDQWKQADQIEAAQRERLLQVLPGASFAALSVSNFDAQLGSAGDARVLGVSLRGSFWIVLSKGPAAPSVVDSVIVEREAPAGWMPRAIPGAKSCSIWAVRYRA